MKVLHINASYKPAFIYGGPTMSVSMLCEHLAIAGVDVTVFTTTANGLNELNVPISQSINIDGVKVLYFKRLTKDHTHFSPSLLRALWNEAKGFDVVHIHAWWNLVSVLSGMVASIRGIPVVISPRGMLSNYSFTVNNTLIKRIIHNGLAKRVLQKSYLHATSDQEKNAIIGLIKPKDIFVIPNLVKLPKPVNQIKADESKPLKLIFLSRVEAKKGLDILFNALANVSIPYMLTIAGDGDSNYIDHLKLLTKTNNIEKHVHWVGFQSDNKFDLLSTHDLFVLPSHDENFGNVVIESLAMGTPVLISKNVGLAEYVTANDLGWVCEAESSSLSNAINNIGNNKNYLDHIRTIAPDIIYKDFAPSTLVEKYVTMYNQITHG